MYIFFKYEKLFTCDIKLEIKERQDTVVEEKAEEDDRAEDDIDEEALLEVIGKRKNVKAKGGNDIDHEMPRLTLEDK